MIDNSGRTALVFGVRNDLSIAWAVAQALHASGCRVACSSAPECLEEVQHLLASAGMEPDLAGCADVRDEDAIAAFARSVHQQTGRIDYVLHAVAYGNHRVMCSRPPADQNTARPEYIDIPFADLVEAFDISAYSLIRICRVVAPLLQEHASIVSLSYQAAARVLAGYAGMAINKAALENMALYLADYFGPRGVRVNTVSAGMVMTTSAAGISGVRALRKATRECAPLGNVKASDIAHACLYYFSDLSRGVTGNLHYVDGGLNIMGPVASS